MKYVTSFPGRDILPWFMRRLINISLSVDIREEGISKLHLDRGSIRLGNTKKKKKKKRSFPHFAKFREVYTFHGLSLPSPTPHFPQLLESFQSNSIKNSKTQLVSFFFFLKRPWGSTPTLQNHWNPRYVINNDPKRRKGVVNQLCINRSWGAIKCFN